MLYSHGLIFVHSCVEGVIAVHPTFPQVFRELPVLAFVYDRHLVDRGRERPVCGAGGLEDRVLLLLRAIALEPVRVVEPLREVLCVVDLRGSLQSVRDRVCL